MPPSKLPLLNVHVRVRRQQRAPEAVAISGDAGGIGEVEQDAVWLMPPRTRARRAAGRGARHVDDHERAGRSVEEQRPGAAPGRWRSPGTRSPRGSVPAKHTPPQLSTVVVPLAGRLFSCGPTAGAAPLPRATKSIGVPCEAAPRGKLTEVLALKAPPCTASPQMPPLDRFMSPPDTSTLAVSVAARAAPTEKLFRVMSPPAAALPRMSAPSV